MKAIEDKRQGCPICGIRQGAQVPHAEYVLAALSHTGENIRSVTQDIRDLDFDHTDHEDGYTRDAPFITSCNQDRVRQIRERVLQRTDHRCRQWMKKQKKNFSG